MSSDNIIENAKKTLENVADKIGGGLQGNVDKTGDTFNDAAAVVESKLAEGLSGVATAVDDLTENTPLKGIGDKIGVAGRDAAGKLEKDSDEHLEDAYPTGE